MAAVRDLVVHVSVRDDLDREFRKVQQQIDAVAYSIQAEQAAERNRAAWLLVAGLALGLWLGMALVAGIGLALAHGPSRWLL
jgi:hypothetical protein